MGLLTSVNNINYNLQAKEEEKRKREVERKKIQQQKEDLNQLQYDIQNMIRSEMQKNFDKYGSNVKIFYYSIENKNIMLENIFHNYSEITKTGVIIRNKRKIIEIFNKNYYKILSDLEKTYKKNDQYLKYMSITESKNEQIQKEKKNYFSIILFFKILGCIIFFPIIFLLILIIAGIKAAN